MDLNEIVSLTELEEVVEALTDHSEYSHGEPDGDEWQAAQDRYDAGVYGA